MKHYRLYRKYDFENFAFDSIRGLAVAYALEAPYDISPFYGGRGKEILQMYSQLKIIN
ncbi:MAG: hypothetical protein LBU84_01045 [Prevotella sp.]|nr:hypothetical protein [Prevotella sp.]